MKKNHLSLPRSPASRSDIDPFIVMDVLAKANMLAGQGRDILHLEVGQPGTPAPQTAIKAAQRALETERLGYTEALGIPRLRERIARHYLDIYDIDVPVERIIVTMGSSAAFVLAFLACFDVGSRVALPSPGYPCYRHIMTALGIEPVNLALSAETRWMPDGGMLSSAVQNQDIAGVILASPANPTGTMLLEDRLEQLLDVAQERGVWFISDEIYHGLTYDVAAKTALAFCDSAIVINSFSKYFSMTGWRIGWMVVPDALVRPIERLAQNLFISAPAVSQHAAIGAFDGYEELEGHRETYRSNRAVLLNELSSAGLGDILPADGAFYIYADVSHLTDDSVAFAQKMLEEIGVAITPGLDFDPQRGKSFIRLSYAGGQQDIVLAVKRIKDWLKVRV